MNLSQIPHGSRVLVDANILIYASQGVSRQCVDFVARCADGDYAAMVPANTLAEVAHNNMVEEARATGLVEGKNPVRSLERRPAVVKGLHLYENALQSLLQSGIRIEAVGRDDFLSMLGLQRRFGLMVNDALMLAVGQRLALDVLASADLALRHVDGWRVYSPSDL